MSRDVRLLKSPFEPGPEIEAFSRRHGDAGGLVSFVGQVRPGGGVEALELRHYEPLTLPGMERLAAKCAERWEIEGMLMLHRVGEMKPGEAIVAVAAAARHRRDAFAAVDFAMDHLKSESWFWKREKSAGEWRWIEPREIDFADLKRWE